MASRMKEVRQPHWAVPHLYRVAGPQPICIHISRRNGLQRHEQSNKALASCCLTRSDNIAHR